VFATPLAGTLADHADDGLETCQFHFLDALFQGREAVASVFDTQAPQDYSAVVPRDHETA